MNENQLVVGGQPPPPPQNQQLQHQYALAQDLANSNLLPESFRGNVPNILIAMDTANRFGIAPIEVMKHCHVIKGKLAFDSKMIIALVNRSGKFDGPIQYWLDENETECVAYAFINGQQYTGPKVTLAMAKANRWGALWSTLPGMMLRYRAAVFFTRLFSPEIILGLDDIQEQQDIQNANGMQQSENDTVAIESLNDYITVEHE